VADRLPSRPGPDPVEIAGPWQHRHVAANGARFHVAEAGPADGPLVLLLHGFPEFWWSWRDQVPALADAGYRTVAMDLRGYGGSDKTPNGYDPITLAQDVSGVVKSLGGRTAVLVGHGWGGYVAWATAVLHAREVRALCVESAPHPSAMLAALWRGGGRASVRHVLAMQPPWRPERRLADPSSGFLRHHLRAWSGPGATFPDAATVATYEAAIGLWPASHCALEYHRWLFRSRLRADGRRFRALMRPPVRQPVLAVSGAADPALPAEGIRRTRALVAGELTERSMPGVGHFPHEERPGEFTATLLDWLAALPAG
jgi:pimeloyl-ACP methyl ester carboxylesterase